jgi:phenylpropionate dioxygenase-like ring-hydroxylating dioxygenase large terminal subunit
MAEPIIDQAGPGYARSSGPTVQSLLDTDTREVPAVLREESYEYLSSDDIDRTQYFSPEFHDLEVERMWTKVWQVACREEDIPDVGDHVVYDIADSSLIVIRSAPGEIRAYHNSCLHRGTQLRNTGGNVRQLRCPFHGFTWNLDGSLKQIPCARDFPHVDPAKFGLPTARVGTWGGFVFVNLDPGAGSLEGYLGDVPKHLDAFGLENRFKAVHVAKVMPCNWKVCLEAFLESFHVVATHPQMLLYFGDANTEYDVYAGDPPFNRMITPQAVSSPHLGDGIAQQDILDALFNDLRGGRPEGLTVPEGTTAREVTAAEMRSRWSERTGLDLSGVSDSEMIDAIQYFVFPNLVPWGGVGSPINYRFQPYGNDPDGCVFDVMMLIPCPPDQPKPRGAATHWLTLEDDWTQAPELGALAHIFNQDSQNLPRIQRGLKASRKPGVTLANYQEIRIRQFHRTLDRYLAG